MDDGEPAGTAAGGGGDGEDAACESRPTVEWRPWGETALAEAREEGRLVLLSLVTPWCAECVAMDEESYADPAVAARIAGEYVPVRADADRRPRLRERYAMGGFPSTVVLTPAGEVVTGATAVGADGLRQILDAVGERWADRGDEIGRVPRALRAGPPPGDDAAIVEPAMVECLENAADASSGGWGTGAKFPLADAIVFSLTRDRGRAVGSLDATLGALQDDDGGVFRYGANADWSDPHRAKLLDTNAAVCRAAAHAYCVTGSERFREAAEGIVDYLAGTLWTGDGFGASQAPPGLDAPPAVPGRTVSEPAGSAAGASPPVDPTVLADRNAVAADALCHLAGYTDAERTRRYAERTLGALAGLVDGDGVVAHFSDAPPAERCVLGDQAAAARAFATAASVLGPTTAPPGDDRAYRDLARTVATTALDELRAGPACVDGPATGAGLCAETLYPVGGNAVLADALVDLAELTGEERFGETALELVDAFAGAADRLEPALAGYARAAARATGEPLVVRVATPAGADLHRAALRIADPDAVVVPAADAGPATDGPVTGTALLSGPAGEATADGPEALLAAVGDVL